MIDKIIPQRLDSSLDLKLTPKNAMIDALNVSFTESSSIGEESTGSVGVIKNPLGNQAALPYNGFDTIPVFGNPKTHQVIGSVTDIKTKIIYYFVYCSDKNEDSIYAYDPLGRLPQSRTSPAGSPNSTRLILTSKGLRFPQNGFVKADVVHVKRSEFAKHPVISDYMKSHGYWDEMSSDAIIYFTDNNGEPKKINAYRSLLYNRIQTIISSGPDAASSTNVYGYLTYSQPEFNDFISACPRVPLQKIAFEFGSDESYNGSNFKSGACFSFAYQLVYNDGIESAISPYSDLAVSPVTLSQGASTFVDYNTTNVCVLTIPAANREVERVKILARQHDTSSFMLIDEISRLELVNIDYKYKFYNDKILTPVSIDTVAKQFDNVPRSAYTQTVTNNRLVYGNYTEGFDNVSVEATITPIAYDLPEETDIKIYIKPSIRSKAEWLDSDSDETKYKKNRAFDGGAAYIFDVEASNLTLPSDSLIRFKLKIAPHKNFHIYKKGGWSMPSRDSNTADRYVAEGRLEQPYPTSIEKEDSYAGDTIQDGIFNIRWQYSQGNGNTTTMGGRIGSDVTRPFVIPGGQLSFFIEFKYIGATKYGQEAANTINRNLINLLSGLEPDNSVESVVVQNTSVHQFDLGLDNFDRLSVFGPRSFFNDPAPYQSDNRCNFISPVFNNELNGGPIGYVIPNKAKASFTFQKVKLSDSLDSVGEVLLTLSEISDIELFSCIKRPWQDGEWVVLSNNFMNNNSTTAIQKINQFISALSAQNINSLNDYYKIESPEASEAIELDFDEINNFTKQFGFPVYQDIPYSFERNNFYDEDYETSIVGTCIIDGECGIGGGPSIPDVLFNERNYNNPGSIFSSTVYIYSEELGWLYSVNGYFFTGNIIGVRTYDIPLLGEELLENAVPGDHLPFAMLSTSTMPLRKKVIDSNTIDDSAYLFISPDVQEYTNAHIEILQKYIDLYSLGSYNDYRTFKANSFHEFGVVYYDERGRHGFVNSIGRVYIPGYSDQERQNKGKIDVKIKINSASPSWANSYRIVHSRSTSISNFIQYTAGAAFVRHTPSNEDFDNIYVSLNYLQKSVVSYSSSFGARNPEGGLDLYKFSPGDRVRVISYETASGVRIYPHEYEFEVVDLVDLGNDNNPIHDDANNIPYNKTGHFLVVKDNSSSVGFDYVSVKNETHLWGNNCIIEIYSPSKSISESSRVFYEISDFISAQNLTAQTISNGDVWWRPIAMNVREEENGIFNDIIVDTEDNQGSNASKSRFFSRYVESNTFTDLYKGDSYGLGRPNVIFEEAKEIRNESGLVYSEPTAQSATRIKYSSFNQSLLNFKDIPEIYGAIVYLIDRGDSLLCIQDNKCCIIPVGRNIISDSAGNELITSSNLVLGSERYYAGNAGCDGSPESVVDAGGTVYFVNKSLGKVFSIEENSVSDISSMGMGSYLRKAIGSVVNSAITSNDNLRIPGGYDEINDEYLFTVKSFLKVAETNSDSTTTPQPDQPTEGFILAGQDVYGCTIPGACNYNPDANVNDGTCYFPALFRDCNGNCLKDSNGDGICDEESAAGCTDPEAYNYSPNANGTVPCIYPGCNDPYACNFDERANANDGSCIYPSSIYRDCNGNCIEYHVDFFGVTTNVCKDQTLVSGCPDPEACNYYPSLNWARQEFCLYAQRGYDCSGNPSGERIDSLIKYINIFGLTFRDLKILNDSVKTNEFFPALDINDDQNIGIYEYLGALAAYGTTPNLDDYVIYPSSDSELSSKRSAGDYVFDSDTAIHNIVPSGGIQNLKLLHIIAKEGITKSQLRYVLDSIKQPKQKPDWLLEKSNEPATKWFEEDRIPENSYIKYHAVSVLTKAPNADILPVSTVNLLDILSRWGGAPDEPNYEQDKPVIEVAQGVVVSEVGDAFFLTGGVTDAPGAITSLLEWLAAQQPNNPNTNNVNSLLEQLAAAAS
jgi:hypothetical protein